MNTSQYDKNDRKNLKRIHRHPVVEGLLKKGREARAELEQVLTKRNERIAVLEKLLKDKGHEASIPPK